MSNAAPMSTVEPQPREAVEQLVRDGFFVFKNILTPEMLDELRTVTGNLLAEAGAGHHEQYRYQGSNISVAYQHDVFARLFAWPAALAGLKQLGFDDPKWMSAYLLSKPPHAPPLYWHQDWWAWDEPCSSSATPPQLFLMYYLTDTTRENGCLRVIPGTHRKRIALHDLLPEAHAKESYTAPLDSPLFVDHPDAIDVAVRAGDLVIGDARVLHAAHANQTSQTRTCLTLWYFPDFSAMSEPIQAFMSRKEPLEAPNWWSGEAGRAMEPLIPYYKGSAQPAKWTRIPGRFLSES